MEKIFIYEQSLMNGTVTMFTNVSAFASRELAEETREAVRESNRGHRLDGMSPWFGDIKELNVYESKDEIPFFQNNNKED